MYIHVCIYIHIYIYDTYVGRVFYGIHEYIYILAMHLERQVCVYVCVYIYIYVYVYVYESVHIQVCMHVYTYIYIYIYRCVYVCVYRYIDIYIYIYIYVPLYIYVYMYIHMYTYVCLFGLKYGKVTGFTQTVVRSFATIAYPGSRQGSYLLSPPQSGKPIFLSLTLSPNPQL